MATVKDIFAQMQAGIATEKDLVNKIGGVYHFKVGGKSYGVDLKNAATVGVKEEAPAKVNMAPPPPTPPGSSSSRHLLAAGSPIFCVSDSGWCVCV
jgi:hypothetical protein